MKHLGLWAALSAIVLLAACNKFQYREQYVGGYDFTTIRTLPDSLDQDSTTTVFAGYVDLYDKDALLIKFKADDSLAPNIAEDGTLTVPGFVASGGTFTGSFTDNSHVSFVSEFRSYTAQRVRYIVGGVRR
jgi:hypothetical protein